MLLDPQFVAEQILNSLQFSMLLFLLAIGLSVVFGLMDYLNLSHGTIYMFAAYVAFSLTNIGGSFWIALLLAPLVAAAVGVLLYFVLLKRAEKGGHLTQVLLTVGVIYMGTDLIRIVYGDLPKNVPQPAALNGAINLFGVPYPSYRLFIIGLGLAIMVVLYFVLERTRLGALVRAGVDDRFEVGRGHGVGRSGGDGRRLDARVGLGRLGGRRFGCGCDGVDLGGRLVGTCSVELGHDDSAPSMVGPPAEVGQR
jgi:branched-chain amino acid transport system permease protein